MFLLALREAQIARHVEDANLLRQIAQRDQQAFSRLYDRYSSLIYTLVLRMVKSTAEAEDLLQEIFVQIWNKAHMFNDAKGSAYTWMMTLARRKAIDKIRSQDFINKEETTDDEDKPVDLPDHDYAANPLHAAISREYEEFMQKGLGELAMEQREIIELSYYEGYTQAQIAEQLNIPLGTVKTRMRQGLLKLRDFLKKRIEERDTK